MLITIDGYSCQGKSYFGNQIAERLGLDFFPTGVLVRFVAHQYGFSNMREMDPVLAIQHALDMLEHTDIHDIIGCSVLRNPQTEKYLKDIADYPFIMPTLQRKLKSFVKGKNVLLDGRYTFDIFPEAHRKYYFRSSVENRMKLVMQAKNMGYEEAKNYIEYRDSFEDSVVIPDSVTIIDPFSFHNNKLLDFLLEDIQR